MKKLYEIKDKLLDQLEEFAGQEINNPTMLEVVDKYAHAIKNIDKIIEKCEEQEYGNSYARNSYHYPYGMYDNSMNNRSSYARNGGSRGGSGGNSYARGYSRDNDLIYELNELMEDAPDDRTRMELQKFIQKMQNM